MINITEKAHQEIIKQNNRLRKIHPTVRLLAKASGDC